MISKGSKDFYNLEATLQLYILMFFFLSRIKTLAFFTLFYLFVIPHKLQPENVNLSIFLALLTWKAALLTPKCIRHVHII